MSITNAISPTYLKSLFTTAICVLALQVSAQKFSKETVLTDLGYLKSSLEETHFNLYEHTTKEAFDSNYDLVRSKIKNDSLNLKEVINLFQQVVAKANNAHTRIEFNSYVQPYAAHLDSGTVFPLEIAIEKGQALVRKNWSGDSSIQIGSELKSINGMLISQVLEKIYPQVAAERQYFRDALLEGFTLPRYYWQVFGEQKEFEVEILQKGKLKTYKLKSINAWDDYESIRKEILINDWALSYPSTTSAYLRPGMFGGDEEKYQGFIDSAFVDINSRAIENLIIDLRNHSGGNDSFGDYLVSYFADRPFRWNSNYQLKTSELLKEDIRKTRDTTSTFWKSALIHENGEIYDYDFGSYDPQPKDRRFTGKVYVLVNRHSYSQSTVTAAQIQDYGFGEIVGEETGEYPNLIASIFTYQLPNTGIKVDIPKGKMERISGVENGRGLIPDIQISDQLRDEKDEILEDLLKLLSAN